MRGDADEFDDRSADSAGGDFDLRVVFDFLRRRKLVILLIAVPLLVPATMVPFLLRPFYEATATLSIRTAPKVMEFGADFMPGTSSDPRAGRQGGPGGGGSEASLMTLVYSDAVLGLVVDQLPEGGTEETSLLSSVREAIAGTSAELMTPEQQREAKIEVIRKRFTATTTGGGAYLKIDAVGGTPSAATFIANAIADAFVRYQEDQRKGASQRAVAWLNQQVYEHREQVARKEQALGELVTTHGLSASSLADDDGQESGLEQVENDLQTARIDLVGAQERLAVLSPRAVHTTGNAEQDQAVATSREQYNQAVLELEAARLRFTPTHPEVRRLEGVVSGLSQRLAADGGVGRGVLTAAEQIEYQSLVSEESRLRSRVRALEKTRADLTVSTGPKSEAITRYRRLNKELAVDKQMLEVLLTRRNETLLTSATKEVGAQVLDYATPPSIPAGPNRLKYLAAGYALAIAAGFGLAFLLEMLDRRLRDPEAIAALLGTSSLGIVPLVETRKALPERQAIDSPGSAAGESYRNVRTALLFAMRAAKLHCLLVTSSIAGEGKTTTCLNLAGAFGRMGRRVIVIDADLRRPRVHRVFHLASSPGLSEVLQGQARVEDAVVRPERSTFDILPAGSIPENPSELLGSTAFSQVITDLKSEYDLVILDSAVLLAVPDALLLAAEADGTLLVHKPGSVDRRALRRVRDDLRRAGARVLGVVFNQIDPASSLHYPTYMYSPYIKQDKA